ncbi:MAG: AIR synthase-related protein, partial [Planctomycetota bacterium]
NTMDKASDDLMKRLVKSMATLNKTASEIMIKIGVNACTDITGFGLIGHAYVIAQMSNVTVKINTGKLPVFEEAKEFARENIMPGGSFSNKDYYGQFVGVEEGIPQEIQDICFDAQTSGGLLMAVDNKKADAMLKELHRQNIKDASIIGEVIPKGKSHIILQAV